MTTLGSGVDGSVRRHDTSYDTGGRIYQLTSYSNTGGSTIVSQVQYGYNGFGEETIEYQGHTSAGVTSGTFNVQYTYADGSGNSNRLISMTYPNGRILDYDYSPTQMVVSGITSTTTTATVTTVQAHGLSIGNKVWIQGAGSHYDGWATVASVPSSTTFTYTIASFTGSSSGTDITEAKLSIDEAISRMDGLQDRAGTSAGDVLEGYSYLGLDTIVIRNRPENNTQLSYVQQSGDTLYSGDGGDQYTGLDRFGRVIDQFWIDTSGPTTTDRIQYAYDRDGNVLYEKNLVNGAFSELFQANGVNNETAAYDSLNRLTAYSRGTLSASGNNGSGVLDTVTTPNSLAESTEAWTLDGVGNTTTLNTDGAGAVTWHPNSRNQLSAIGSTNLTFDNNGNTTIDETGKYYKWDAWNKLVQLKASNNSTVLLTLKYDVTGRMIDFDNGSNAHMFYDMMGRPVEGHYTYIHSQYVWGLDYQNDLILRDRNNDAPTTGDSTGNYGESGSGLEERLYVQHDANWDVTSLLDTSATIQERMTYTPYGDPQIMHANWTNFDDSSSSSYQWHFLFQGVWWEPAGGFSYMGARLLSTQTGRWMSADPSGYSDGADLYELFHDAPASRIDPTGRNATLTRSASALTINLNLMYLWDWNDPQNGPPGMVKAAYGEFLAAAARWTREFKTAWAKMLAPYRAVVPSGNMWTFDFLPIKLNLNTQLADVNSRLLYPYEQDSRFEYYDFVVNQSDSPHPPVWTKGFDDVFVRANIPKSEMPTDPNERYPDDDVRCEVLNKDPNYDMTGYWYFFNTDPTMPPHEVGHFLGLQDRYHDDPKKPASPSVTDPGWAGNLMSDQTEVLRDTQIHHILRKLGMAYIAQSACPSSFGQFGITDAPDLSLHARLPESFARAWFTGTTFDSNDNFGNG